MSAVSGALAPSPVLVPPLESRNAGSANSTTGVGTKSEGSIAVIDPLPAYRRGLSLTLVSAGFNVDECCVEDAGEKFDLVIMTLGSEREWKSAAALCARGPRLLALLVESGAACYARALAYGLSGAIDRDASLSEVTLTVRAVFAGKVVLPPAVASEMAASFVRHDCDRPGTQALLSESEVDWLRRMAQGLTISQLARRSNYSERQMHRLVAKMYGRLGAANRAEALVLAARLGILA